MTVGIGRKEGLVGVVGDFFPSMISLSFTLAISFDSGCDKICLFDWIDGGFLGVTEGEG
jgi:hypothetical protein